MLRYAWSQLRRRTGRSAALLVGVLVATTGFITLTGATAASRLVVRETVETGARGAYDILVRPTRSRTEFERAHDRVRPNFLADVYGGISLDEWARIGRVPGVEVAAPVAMLGYTAWSTTATVDLTDHVDPTRAIQVLLLRPTVSADRGLTRTELPAGLVYVTRRRVVWPVRPVGGEWIGQYSDGVRRDTGLAERLCGYGDPAKAPYELQDDGRALPICANGSQYLGFDTWQQVPRYVAYLRRDGRYEVSDALGFATYVLAPGATPPWTVPRDRLTVTIDVPVPLLVAAIDPGQEAALNGLDRAVVAGRYLTDGDVSRRERSGTRTMPMATATVPVLVSSRWYVDEQLLIDVAPLPDVAVVGRSSQDLLEVARTATAQGPRIATIDVAAVAGDRLGRGPFLLAAGLQAGRTRYLNRGEALAVAPQPPVTGLDGWEPGSIGTPALAGDVALRPLLPPVPYLQLGTQAASLYGQAVGTYDPERVTVSASGLAAPAETYQQPEAAGADPRTRELLGDAALRPNTNPGGYLAMPPTVLIGLTALAEIWDDPIPISAVRVRVAGIQGFDEASRERIRLVAEDIATATGLDVDIVYGASPGPQTVILPPGSFGRPELALAEPWTRKGIAAVIVNAVDRKSVVLFVLILVVSALFLANAVSAAVRDRRRELAVLACLGWNGSRLAASVLTEVGLIGLAAGVLSAAAAPVLGRLSGVDVDPRNAALAVPAALGLALLAGAQPALRAARAHPGAAIHPAVWSPRRGPRGPRRRVIGLSLLQLGRVPGRTALGALALALGVGAATLLAAVTFAFHGTVVGTLLGDAVSLRARGADLAAVAGTVLLGAAAIADVLYINIRERSGELAALRATGWSDWAVVRLVLYEGVGIALLGAVVGAGAGLALAAVLAGAVTVALVGLSATTAAGGVLLAAVAASVPALVLQRRGLGAILAEE